MRIKPVETEQQKPKDNSIEDAIFLSPLYDERLHFQFLCCASSEKRGEKTRAFLAVSCLVKEMWDVDDQTKINTNVNDLHRERLVVAHPRV